jgi:hypothetical protein
MKMDKLAQAYVDGWKYGRETENEPSYRELETLRPDLEYWDKSQSAFKNGCEDGILNDRWWLVRIGDAEDKQAGQMRLALEV